jgi:tape measure domain-containing protein
MANVTTELKVLVKAIGRNEIDKLSKSLGDLGKKAVEPVNQDLKASVAQLKTLSQQSTRTKNNVKGFSTAFKELANNLEIGSKEFKEATAQAARLDKQLEKMEGRRRSRSGGGAVRAAGGVAATALGAGVFGGVEGFVGALGGGILGGVPGAAAGAVAGATVSNLRKQAGGIAELVAEYNNMQIALAGVSKSQEDFNKSLQSVTQFSKDFLIPIEDAIGQYTRLKASVVGAGGSTEDTDKAFRGMAAAILATGGNVNDFNSALVATAQVFSKGKVSAEELRQQIGERLPGAFTIFADAMGISTRELDEMLERGEVRLSSFSDFTEDLFARFGKTSQVLGSAPEKAGQRLQVALSFAAIEYGGFFQKVGAGFQDYLTNLLNFAVKNKQKFIEIAADVAAFGEEIVFQLKNAAKNIATPFINLFSFFEIKIEDLKKQLGLLFEATKIFGKLVFRADAFDDFQLPKSSRLSVQERSAQIQAQLEELFSQFAPTEFGSGLRDGFSGLGGGAGGDGGGAAGKIRADISQEEYDTRLQIVAARKGENKLLLAQLNADLARQKLSESDLRDRERAIRLLEINLTEQENVVKILEDRAKMQVEYIDGEEETANAVAFTEKALGAAGKQIARNLNAQKKVKQELTETEEFSKKIGQTLEQGIGSALEGIIFQTKSLKESLSDVLRSVAGLFIQSGVRSAFSGLGLDNFFKMNKEANGNVYAQNGVVPFARGGIVNKPTLFPFAKGIGLMGEAGPEAIMPLKRGPSGRLGVEASGGGTSVVVNVDAKGTQVQGSDNRGKALGSAISAAIQAELVRQKRPGGLLA